MQQRTIKTKHFERKQDIRPLSEYKVLKDLIPQAKDFPGGYICVETWNGLHWGRAHGDTWLYEHEPPMDNADLYNAQVRAFNETHEIYSIVGNRGVITRTLKRVESGGTEIPCFETELMLLRGEQEEGMQNGFSRIRHKTGASIILPVSGDGAVALHVCCLCAEHPETGALYINDQMYLSFKWK